MQVIRYYFLTLSFLWFLLHHNIVYSKSPVYNNLNGPEVNIKGPILFHLIFLYIYFIINV
jgi:hypothetical protein